MCPSVIREKITKTESLCCGIISDSIAHCHCVNCSENNKCLSRGNCDAGYWGDNCMLYNVLKNEVERHQTVYSTNSSIFSNDILVIHNTLFHHASTTFLDNMLSDYYERAEFHTPLVCIIHNMLWSLTILSFQERNLASQIYCLLPTKFFFTSKWKLV